MKFLLRLFTPSEWKKLTTTLKLAFASFVFAIFCSACYGIYFTVGYLNEVSDIKPYSDPILKVQKIDDSYRLSIMHGFTNSGNESGFIEPFKLEFFDAKTNKILGVFNTFGFVKLEIKKGHVDSEISFYDINELKPFSFNANKKYLLKLTYKIKNTRHFSTGDETPPMLYNFMISDKKLCSLDQMEANSPVIEIHLHK